MNQIVCYTIAKTLEFFFFVAAIIIYANIIYNPNKMTFLYDIYFSIGLVVTFYIISLYIFTSLFAHFIFQNKIYFGFICGGTYGLSALLFVFLNEIKDYENLAIFIFPLPFVYMIGNFAKQFTLKLFCKITR